MVDGELSRNFHGTVRFYDGAIELSSYGDWRYKRPSHWTIEEWEKTYDLAAPLPGEKFYVSIEL